jgi:hypothetical protein
MQSKTEVGESEDSDGGDIISNIAATNPLAAQLCVLPRASQHATPSANSPAPPTRTTVKAAGVSSGAPSRNSTVIEGKQRSAKPAPNSITAVTVCRAFMDQNVLNEREEKLLLRAFRWLKLRFHFLCVLIGRFPFDCQFADAPPDRLLQMRGRPRIISVLSSLPMSSTA